MRKVLYIFGLLTDADIEWIARTGTRRRLSDGDVLTREGEAPEALIILLEGELLVTAETVGQIARLAVGEIVGEVSLVDSAPASATVTARGEGIALFLDRTALLHKLHGDEGFAARFYRALAMFLADRLRAARQPDASRLMDEGAVVQDELDLGIVDHISAAGERFNRMLRILRDQS
jgi:CRP/FNR family transcriptional regulator, cyclic AMP receptor protein